MTAERRAYRRLPGRKRQHASTEPRSDDRGEDTPPPPAVDGRTRLQRSRGPMTAESFEELTCAKTAVVASTEPRSDDRGEERDPRLTPRSVASFNGAAVR